MMCMCGTCTRISCVCACALVVCTYGCCRVCACVSMFVVHVHVLTRMRGLVVLEQYDVAARVADLGVGVVLGRNKKCVVLSVTCLHCVLIITAVCDMHVLLIPCRVHSTTHCVYR